MATIDMGATDLASYNHTLVAATVDTITIDRDVEYVHVCFDAGTDALFFTVDGSEPTVDGPNCYRVWPIAGNVTSLDRTGLAPTVVKVISAGASTYSVQGSV